MEISKELSTFRRTAFKRSVLFTTIHPEYSHPHCCMIMKIINVISINIAPTGAWGTFVLSNKQRSGSC